MATHAHTPGAPTRAPAIDRRMLLAGGAAVPLLATEAAAAPVLEAAFANWKRSIWTINHTPGLSDTATEALWDRATRAELTVMRSPDASPRVAAMRLWMGLEFEMQTAVDTDAVTTEDIGSLMSRVREHDWHVQCTIRALQALVASSGRA